MARTGGRRPGQIDGRADIYALGAILYEVMTGRPPFKSSSPVNTIRQVLERPLRFRRPRVFPGTIAALEPVCLKALAKDPRSASRRPSSWPSRSRPPSGLPRAHPLRRASTTPDPDQKPKDASKGLFGRFFG